MRTHLTMRRAKRNPIARAPRIGPSPTSHAIDALAATLRRECPLADLFEAVRQLEENRDMMKLEISIEIENAAFTYDRNGEVAKILQKFAKRLLRTITPMDTRYSHTLLDYNGNTVGRVVVKEER